MLIVRFFTNTMPDEIFLYLSTVTINFLSLGCGTVFSWTSPVIPRLKEATPSNPLGYTITASEESLIASIQSIGAAIGPFVASQCADRFGRRTSLNLFVVPMVASYMTLAFASKIELYYFARLLIGIGTGCILAVIPMYVGEIAKNTNRGALGCFTEVFITVGELFCVVTGYFVDDIMLLSIICAGPFVAFLILSLIFIPESPYYYSLTDNREKAEESLKKFRQSSDVLKELEEVERNVKESLQLNRSFKDLFKSKELIRGLIVSIGLMFCQQMNGISAIIFYLEPIFNAAATNTSSDNTINELSPIIFSVVQVISCSLSARFVDKLGRRILLIVSEIGMAISLLVFGVFFYLRDTDGFDVSLLNFLPLTCMIVYITSFAFGAGPLAWAMVGELFPPDVKALSAPLVTSCNMVFAYSTSAAFPFCLELLGMAATMWILTVFCVLGLVFVVFVVPETKGRSLYEIQVQLGMEARDR